MGFFSLIMLDIALELALKDPTYEDMASKFFEHFVAIVDAMNGLGGLSLYFILSTLIFILAIIPSFVFINLNIFHSVISIYLCILSYFINKNDDHNRTYFNYLYIYIKL